MGRGSLATLSARFEAKVDRSGESLDVDLAVAPSGGGRRPQVTARS